MPTVDPGQPRHWVGGRSSRVTLYRLLLCQFHGADDVVVGVVIVVAVATTTTVFLSVVVTVTAADDDRIKIRTFVKIS